MASYKRITDIIIENDRSIIRAINDNPGHSVQLKPFQESLSGGDKKLVAEHLHDHAHAHSHAHIHGHDHSH